MVLYSNLQKGAGKVSPGSVNNVSQAVRMKVNDVKYFAGTKTETFYGEVGSSSKASSYSVLITFKGIDSPNEGLTEDEIAMGFQPKPSLSKHEIQVRCSCPSYRFRFDQANRMAKAGTGAKFGVYHRISDRKPNNPDHIPGACKHIQEFIEYLLDNGFIHE